MPFVARRVIVVTTHDPASLRESWRATLGNHQPGGPVGVAATECEAVANLYDEIAQREQADEERYAWDPR
jgi:hypothetical protein